MAYAAAGWVYRGPSCSDIIGVNLGGLGTLIASMASLISYKLIAREESQMKGAYFRYFTIANISFLVILLVFSLAF